jgi:hypothetical protein
MKYDRKERLAPNNLKIVRAWDETSNPPHTGGFRWLLEDQEGNLWIFYNDNSHFVKANHIDWCVGLAKTTPAWCLDENTKHDPSANSYDNNVNRFIVTMRDALRKAK